MLVLLGGATVGACERAAPRPSGAELALAARLEGVWAVEFFLDRAPLGAPPGTAPDGRRRTTGTLTLLESTRGHAGAWLARPPTHTGVYDVEFSPLGFSLRAPGPVPSLVATAVAPDSVVAVMPAGLDDGVILLRGTLAGDSVLGTWSYEGRSASGWGGTLVLRHRRGT